MLPAIWTVAVLAVSFALAYLNSSGWTWIAAGAVVPQGVVAATLAGERVPGGCGANSARPESPPTATTAGFTGCWTYTRQRRSRSAGKADCRELWMRVHR